jgi:double-stranded uracil-DNA glycosylase
MRPQSDILEDLLAEGLRVVFCGTQASTASAMKRAYYAKPGNRFWATLHQIGLTPHRFAPEDYAALLPLGIGLTDLAKRTAGQDAQIAPDHLDVNRLETSLRRFKPLILAFTSKTAAGFALRTGTGRLAYGRQVQPFCGIETYVLPSTSGLATSHWDIGPWQALGARFRELHHATA